MELIIIAFLGLVIIFLIVFLVFKRKPEKQPEALMMLQQQLNHISQVLDTKLTESTKTFQSQFNQNTAIVRDIIERLTKLDEANRQVMNYAEQLQSLEDILKNPKQRGVLGEYFLEEVLANVFSPSQYQMQYAFRDGQTVDAVILSVKIN